MKEYSPRVPFVVTNILRESWEWLCSGDVPTDPHIYFSSILCGIQEKIKNMHDEMLKIQEGAYIESSGILLHMKNEVRQLECRIMAIQTACHSCRLSVEYRSKFFNTLRDSWSLSENIADEKWKHLELEYFVATTQLFSLPVYLDKLSIFEHFLEHFQKYHYQKN